jgi:hypothetical protein
MPWLIYGSDVVLVLFNASAFFVAIGGVVAELFAGS